MADDSKTRILILVFACGNRGRPFKQNTISDHVIILKQFLIWMIENHHLDLPEKKIRAIKNPPQG